MNRHHTAPQLPEVADFTIIYGRSGLNGAFFVFFGSTLGLSGEIFYARAERCLGYRLI